MTAKTKFQFYVFGATLNNVCIEKRVTTKGAVQLRYIFKDSEIKNYRLNFPTQDAYVAYLDRVCDERTPYNSTLCLDQLISAMNSGN